MRIRRYLDTRVGELRISRYRANFHRPCRYDGGRQGQVPCGRGWGVLGLPHTARCNGESDRSRWLLGAPVVFESTLPVMSWAEVAPRLAGLPPGTDEQFIRLMM